MPRRLRMYLPEVPAHLVHRGHNRQNCFLVQQDYQDYLNALRDGADRYAVRIHAWCLMTNHVHLLATPSQEDGIPRMLQHVGRCYVRNFNQKYARSGTLWEGRCWASLVQTDHYLLRAYRYIEMNPVLARMTSAPEKYRWSSHRANAFGETDPLTHPHPLILTLGASEAERRKAYRNLFKTHPSADECRKMRAALDANMPQGSEGFIRQVERWLDRPIGHQTRGRPRRLPATEKGSE